MIDNDQSDVDQLNKQLQIINFILTPLSIIGATLMLIFCLRSRQISVVIKLVSTMAISDLIYSLTNAIDFFNSAQNDFLCRFRGITNSFFFIFSILIVTSISVLHYKFSNRNFWFNESLFFNITLAVVLISTSIFSLGPLLTDKITVVNYDIGCYEDYEGNDRSGRNIYFVYSNLPLLVGPVMTLVFYKLSAKRIARVSQMLLSDVQVDTSPLFWYPVVMSIMLLPQLVVTFVTYCITDRVIPWLAIISFVTMRSIGLVNAVTYIKQKKIYRQEKSVKSVTSGSSQDIKNSGPRWSSLSIMSRSELQGR